MELMGCINQLTTDTYSIHGVYKPANITVGLKWLYLSGFKLNIVKLMGIAIPTTMRDVLNPQQRDIYQP